MIQSVFKAMLDELVDTPAEISYARLNAQQSSTASLTLDECRIYPGPSLAAVVRGVEFSLGNEDFMLQRGVQLDLSSVDGVVEQQKVFYLALEDEIIAKCVLSEPFFTEARDLKDSLRKLKYRMLLVSDGDNTDLDGVSRGIGVELADTVGGLTLPQINEKLQGLPPHLYFSDQHMPSIPVADLTIAASRFDELHWTVDEGEVTIFSRDIRLLGKLIHIVRLGATTLKRVTVYAPLFSLLLFVLAAAAVLTPLEVIAISILVETVVLLLLSSRVPSLLRS
jgi:hypothetical protein